MIHIKIIILDLRGQKLYLAHFVVVDNHKTSYLVGAQ